MEHEFTIGDGKKDQTAALMNELRVWKEKVSKLGQQQLRDQQARKNLEEKIEKVQQENKVLKLHLENYYVNCTVTSFHLRVINRIIQHF